MTYLIDVSVLDRVPVLISEEERWLRSTVLTVVSTSDLPDF